MLFLRRLLHSQIKLSSLRYSTERLAQNLYFCEHLNINKAKAEYIAIKHPAVTKLSSEDVKNLIYKVNQLGYNKDILIEEPVLFSILPITLEYRYKVLEECGFTSILPQHLISYLNIVRKKQIKELRQSGLIPAVMNVENRLAGYMTQWPTSLTTLIQGNSDEKTIFELRIKIIQRYLELVLDLSEDDFHRGVETYPTIKHRPLSVINETLTVLQSVIKFPNKKITTNLYLVHADPENLKKIVYTFRSIAGIDIKEILRLHPKIALKNYKTLFEIRKVLHDYGISEEAQLRCFEIYTLSPETIKDRLENSKAIPEFNALYNHPRFLKMIYYNTTALSRLRKLTTNNKRCLSLHILSGGTERYKIFEKSPGDRSGKGRDLVFFLKQKLGNGYSACQIRAMIRRHPFWINVPVVQVSNVYQKLSLEFSNQDIYENCALLLYPLNKINEVVKQIKVNMKRVHPQEFIDHIDLNKLGKSQILSLALYQLEKSHYFTGNGVWTEDQIRNVVDLSNNEMPKVIPYSQ